MTIKIHAAVRLAAAKADDDQTLNYLKSLGIKPRGITRSYDGLVVVEINNATTALEVLKKSLKKKPYSAYKKLPPNLRSSMRFDLGQGRQLDLNVDARGKASIILMDADAKTSPY